jgi:spore germination protein
VHIFHAGDTLARIAAAYGLTVDQVVTANRLASPDAVVDGQRLVIPLSLPPRAVPGE